MVFGIQKKVKKKVEHGFGVQDPYYVVQEVSQEDGTTKVDKVKREIPEGISKHDEEILEKVKKRAWRLELFFSLLGLNVGWGALIGLIPVVGDLVNLYLAYGTFKLASQIEGGLTSWEDSKMVANAGVNSALGFVPFVGDVAAAVYKGNTRNAILLNDILVKRGQKNLKKPSVDKTDLVPSGKASQTPNGKDHLKSRKIKQ